MTIALAEPLPSRRTASPDGVPTRDEIDVLHREYETALRELFDTYKASAGYPDAELLIL
jgi:hypothetical protein